MRELKRLIRLLAVTKLDIIRYILDELTTYIMYGDD